VSGALLGAFVVVLSVAAFEGNDTPRPSRPTGPYLLHVGQPSNTYATFTYDDCVRNNLRRDGRRKREISVTTSPTLSPAERLFAVSWGVEATTPKYSTVAITRNGKTIAATRAEARGKAQTLLLFTWVENNAQVTVRSTDFSENVVLGLISKLIVGTPEDYKR
jgi:hypothetical protein